MGGTFGTDTFGTGVFGGGSGSASVYGSGTYGSSLYGTAGADTTPPTIPSGLAATAISPSRIDLTWSASTDNFAVTGYGVYRAGTLLATVGSVTSYSDTSVSPSTTYVYTVDAFDAAGNRSSQSASASATTPTTQPDTSAPTTPTGLTATAVSSAWIHLVWNASTDNVAVTGYTIYRGGSTLTTVGTRVTTYDDTGLSASTTYSYKVDAFDAAGNHSLQSGTASAATPASGPPPPPPAVPSLIGAPGWLGPIISTAGTTYTAGQVLWMMFQPSLQVDWTWDLLDNQLQYKLDLSPLIAADRPPVISNDSTRAVKRQLTNLVMRADGRINVFQDLIRPHFRLRASDGGWLDWPLGLFMFTPPNREISQGITWWTVVAPDLSQLLVDAALDQATAVLAGASYTDAIGSLLASYGGATPLTYRLVANNSKLPAPLNWDAGTNYLKVINDLLAAINYVPAAMEGNALISEPQPDYTTQSPDLVLDAVTGQAVLVGPFSEQTDYTNAYNIVRVVGTDPRRAPVFGFYRNTRTDSPVSMFRWHPRTKVIQDSSLASNDAANGLAFTEAQAAARIFSTFRIGLMAFPFLKDLDIVKVTYSSADDGIVSQPYLCLHWAHPCSPNQITTVDLQRIVSI